MKNSHECPKCNSITDIKRFALVQVGNTTFYTPCLCKSCNTTYNVFYDLKPFKVDDINTFESNEKTQLLIEYAYENDLFDSYAEEHFRAWSSEYENDSMNTVESKLKNVCDWSSDFEALTDSYNEDISDDDKIDWEKDLDLDLLKHIFVKEYMECKKY